MSSRAVLLGTNGWPFLIRYWLENFKTWEHKVDKLYIAVDHHTTRWPYFYQYLEKRVKDNPKIVLLPNCQGWPRSYTDAFNASKEDLLLIMHDDCWINDPNILDKYFKEAEEGKVLTPLWAMYSPQQDTEEWLNKKYPGIFPLELKEKIGNMGGWRGHSFILYLIFISRKNMLKTTIDFNGWQHPNLKFGADTGFVLELDLLDAGVEIVPIPRYEIQDEQPGIPYLHMGGGGDIFA